MKLDDKTSDLFPNEAPTGKKRKTKKKPEMNDLLREARALSNLDELQYEHNREAAAERLGIRVSKLDQMVKKLRQKRQSGQFQAAGQNRVGKCESRQRLLGLGRPTALQSYCVKQGQKDHSGKREREFRNERPEAKAFRRLVGNLGRARGEQGRQECHVSAKGGAGEQADHDEGQHVARA